MNLDMSQFEFLAVDETADILRVSRAYVYRLIAHEEIQAVRLGKSIKIRRSELNAYIEHKSSGYLLGKE